MKVVLDLAGVGAAEMPWMCGRESEAAFEFEHTEEQAEAALRAGSREYLAMPGDEGVPRPTWDEVYMEFAEIMKRRSRCSRDQVGCVIVTADNRVAAASYNGPPPGATESGKRPVPPTGRCNEWCPRATNPVRDPAYADCYSNHAESNAIARADFTDIKGGTVYVTSTPCVSCAKNVAACGVGRVVFRVDPLLPRDVPAARWFLRDLGGLEVTVL